MRSSGALGLALCIGTMGVWPAAQGETLDDAWAVAAAVDHRLQAGRHATAAAQATLGAAQARRWPSGSLQAGYTRLNETPTSIGSFTLPAPLPASSLDIALPVQQPSFYAYKAEVSLPLYTGGRIERGIEAATSLRAAALGDELRAAMDLRLVVAQAYVACLHATRLVSVAQSGVDSLRSFERDVNNLFDKGLVARNDTLAARVAGADAQLRRIAAGHALNLAQAAYNRLLGRAFEQPLDLQDSVLQAGPADLATLTTHAQASRPELVVLAEQGAALRAQAAAVQAGLAPQVAAVASYTRQQNRYQAHEGIAAVGIGLSWAVFDGGLLRHESAALAARAAAVDAQRDEARSLITLQVRQAWLGTQDAAQRIVVADAALDNAEENLRLARDRYSHGMAVYTEVLQAETSRNASRTQGHAATYDALLAELQLRRAAGTL